MVLLNYNEMTTTNKKEQNMGDRQVEGKFVFEKDTKNMHRFKIVGSGMSGSLYVPKTTGQLPKEITLTLESLAPAAPAEAAEAE
jgi:hypothetical protein